MGSKQSSPTELRSPQRASALPTNQTEQTTTNNNNQPAANTSSLPTVGPSAPGPSSSADPNKPLDSQITANGDDDANRTRSPPSKWNKGRMAGWLGAASNNSHHEADENQVAATDAGSPPPAAATSVPSDDKEAKKTDSTPDSPSPTAAKQPTPNPATSVSPDSNSSPEAVPTSIANSSAQAEPTTVLLTTSSRGTVSIDEGRRTSHSGRDSPNSSSSDSSDSEAEAAEKDVEKKGDEEKSTELESKSNSSSKPSAAVETESSAPQTENESPLPAPRILSPTSPATSSPRKPSPKTSPTKNNKLDPAPAAFASSSRPATRAGGRASPNGVSNTSFLQPSPSASQRPWSALVSPRHLNGKRGVSPSPGSHSPAFYGPSLSYRPQSSHSIRVRMSPTMSPRDHGRWPHLSPSESSNYEGEEFHSYDDFDSEAHVSSEYLRHPHRSHSRGASPYNRPGSAAVAGSGSLRMHSPRRSPRPATASPSTAAAAPTNHSASFAPSPYDPQLRNISRAQSARLHYLHTAVTPNPEWDSSSPAVPPANPPSAAFTRARYGERALAAARKENILRNSGYGANHPFNQSQPLPRSTRNPQRPATSNPSSSGSGGRRRYRDSATTPNPVEVRAASIEAMIETTVLSQQQQRRSASTDGVRESRSPVPGAALVEELSNINSASAAAAAMSAISAAEDLLRTAKEIARRNAVQASLARSRPIKAAREAKEKEELLKAELALWQERYLLRSERAGLVEASIAARKEKEKAAKKQQKEFEKERKSLEVEKAAALKLVEEQAREIRKKLAEKQKSTKNKQKAAPAVEEEKEHFSSSSKKKHSPRKQSSSSHKTSVEEPAPAKKKKRKSKSKSSTPKSKSPHIAVRDLLEVRDRVDEGTEPELTEGEEYDESNDNENVDRPMPSFHKTDGHRSRPQQVTSPDPHSRHLSPAASEKKPQEEEKTMDSVQSPGKAAEPETTPFLTEVALDAPETAPAASFDVNTALVPLFAPSSPDKLIARRALAKSSSLPPSYEHFVPFEQSASSALSYPLRPSSTGVVANRFPTARRQRSVLSWDEPQLLHPVQENEGFQLKFGQLQVHADWMPTESDDGNVDGAEKPVESPTAQAVVEENQPEQPVPALAPAVVAPPKPEPVTLPPPSLEIAQPLTPVAPSTPVAAAPVAAAPAAASNDVADLHQAIATLSRVLSTNRGSVSYGASTATSPQVISSGQQSMFFPAEHAHPGMYAAPQYAMHYPHPPQPMGYAYPPQMQQPPPHAAMMMNDGSMHHNYYAAPPPQQQMMSAVPQHIQSQTPPSRPLSAVSRFNPGAGNIVGVPSGGNSVHVSRGSSRPSSAIRAISIYPPVVPPVGQPTPPAGLNYPHSESQSRLAIRRDTPDPSLLPRLPASDTMNNAALPDSAPPMNAHSRRSSLGRPTTADSSANAAPLAAAPPPSGKPPQVGKQKSLNLDRPKSNAGVSTLEKGAVKKLSKHPSSSHAAPAAPPTVSKTPSSLSRKASSKKKLVAESNSTSGSAEHSPAKSSPVVPTPPAAVAEPVAVVHEQPPVVEVEHAQVEPVVIQTDPVASQEEVVADSVPDAVEAPAAVPIENNSVEVAEEVAEVPSLEPVVAPIVASPHSFVSEDLPPVPARMDSMLVLAAELEKTMAETETIGEEDIASEPPPSEQHPADATAIVSHEEPVVAEEHPVPVESEQDATSSTALPEVASSEVHDQPTETIERSQEAASAVIEETVEAPIGPHDPPADHVAQLLADHAQQETEAAPVVVGTQAQAAANPPSPNAADPTVASPSSASAAPVTPHNGGKSPSRSKAGSRRPSTSAAAPIAQAAEGPRSPSVSKKYISRPTSAHASKHAAERRKSESVAHAPTTPVAATAVTTHEAEVATASATPLEHPLEHPLALSPSTPIAASQPPQQRGLFTCKVSVGQSVLPKGSSNSSTSPAAAHIAIPKPVAESVKLDEDDYTDDSYHTDPDHEEHESSSSSDSSSDSSNSSDSDEDYSDDHESITPSASKK